MAAAKRYIDRPVVGLQIYMLVFVSVCIVVLSVKLHYSEYRPHHLTFFECVDLRVLCYAWACFGLLAMSLVLDTGWLVPMSIIGLWISQLGSSSATGDDFDAMRTNARWGILGGLVVGIFLNALRNTQQQSDKKQT